MPRDPFKLRQMEDGDDSLPILFRMFTASHDPFYNHDNLLPPNNRVAYFNFPLIHY